MPVKKKPRRTPKGLLAEGRMAGSSLDQCLAVNDLLSELAMEILDDAGVEYQKDDPTGVTLGLLADDDKELDDAHLAKLMLYAARRFRFEITRIDLPEKEKTASCALFMCRAMDAFAASDWIAGSSRSTGR